MTCGWVTTLLTKRKHLSTIEAYRAVFIGYAVIGVIKFVLTLLLTTQCEADKQPEGASARETDPLLNGDNGNDANKRGKANQFTLLSRLSTESKIILAQLCVLFAFDNFASGLAPMYGMIKTPSNNFRSCG